MRDRIDRVYKKLDGIFTNITPYKWYYDSPYKINAPSHLLTDELKAVLEQFDGIYDYLCQDYDTESLWGEREVDAFDQSLEDDYEEDDFEEDNDNYAFRAENMSDLEFEVQKLFPEGCFPLSYCYDDLNYECDIDGFYIRKGWHLLMLLNDSNYYCLDLLPEDGGKVARIVHVIDRQVTVVADNIIDFMENIMIPKIEELIRKHKKI